MKSKSSLTHLIIIESITEQVIKRAAELNVTVCSFDRLREIGRNNLKDTMVIYYFKIWN